MKQSCVEKTIRHHTVEPTVILYEYPFNESIRTMCCGSNTCSIA
jgi:hypothetical protein